MKCSVGVAYTSCAFTSPLGQPYYLYEGARFEGGRITKLNGSETECGVFIDKVKEKDHGSWYCTVTFNDKGQQKKAQDTVTINVASREKSFLIY